MLYANAWASAHDGLFLSESDFFQRHPALEQVLGLKCHSQTTGQVDLIEPFSFELPAH